MAVNKPIIAAGYTRTRAKAFATSVDVGSYEPGGTRRYVDEKGDLALEDTAATRAGEVYVQKLSSTTGQVYISVEIGGAFIWKKHIRTVGATDPRTGQLKDPLYDWYGNRA